jgi:hypothetical protein
VECSKPSSIVLKLEAENYLEFGPGIKFGFVLQRRASQMELALKAGLRPDLHFPGRAREAYVTIVVLAPHGESP